MHHRTALVASLAAAAASTVRASTLHDPRSPSADPEVEAFLRARESGCSGHSHGLAKRQEGGEVGGPTTSAEALNYHCDADRCKLPNCHCADRNPPGGLNRDQVPQFVLFTADDAIQVSRVPVFCPSLCQHCIPDHFRRYSLSRPVLILSRCCSASRVAVGESLIRRAPVVMRRPDSRAPRHTTSAALPAFVILPRCLCLPLYAHSAVDCRCWSRQ